MSTKTTKQDPLVEYLEGLKADEDRATLASLRASWHEGRSLDGLRVVLPYISRGATTREEDDALLLARLFALHPESGGVSVATALRMLMEKTNPKNESVEARFRALLDAERSELGTHLRHAVSLAASNNIAIDWRNLRRAIRHWDHHDDFVRRDWARDFWSPDHSDNTTEAGGTP